ERAEVDGDRHLRVQGARRDGCLAGVEVDRSEETPRQPWRDGEQGDPGAAEPFGDLLEVRPVPGIAREVDVAGMRPQHEAQPQARVPVAGPAAAVMSRRDAPDADVADARPLPPVQLGDAGEPEALEKGGLPEPGDESGAMLGGKSLQ